MGSDEHKLKDNEINKKQQNWMIYKERNTYYYERKWNEKSASTTTKEIPNEDKEKNAGTEIVKPKISNLLSKTLSRYKTNILLRRLKFTTTPERNKNELKSNIHNQNSTHRLRLAEFFQNKEATDSEENPFKKQSTFTPPRNRDRDLDHQIDVLNNLNLEINGDKI